MGCKRPLVFGLRPTLGTVAVCDAIPVVRP
jgi:hypothetical protein